MSHDNDPPIDREAQPQPDIAAAKRAAREHASSAGAQKAKKTFAVLKAAHKGVELVRELTEWLS